MLSRSHVLEETKKNAFEEKERELRGNNFIIYRVPEASSADDKGKQDKLFCMELIRDALEVDAQESDIKKIFRLGKKDTAVRPILVQLRERSIKNRVMESLFKLKDCDDKFKNVSVTHDLTQQERIECKALVAEAKKRQDDEKGEWLWRVRGVPGLMKVIRIPRN